AYLSGGANNYLLAVATQGGAIGVALLDVSTGEFVAGEDAEPEGGVLAAALLRRPSEILVSEALRGSGTLLTRLQATGAALTFGDPVVFAGRRGAADLAAHFGAGSLEAFGVGDLTVRLQAAAAALAYARPRADPRASGCPRGPRRGARDAREAPRSAARDRGPRAPHQPRHARRRPRPRPRRPARWPGADRRSARGLRRARGAPGRGGARRPGRCRRPARAPGGRGGRRAVPYAERRRRDP